MASSFNGRPACGPVAKWRVKYCFFSIMFSFLMWLRDRKWLMDNAKFNAAGSAGSLTRLQVKVAMAHANVLLVLSILCGAVLHWSGKNLEASIAAAVIGSLSPIGLWLVGKFVRDPVGFLALVK